MPYYTYLVAYLILLVVPAAAVNAQKEIMTEKISDTSEEITPNDRSRNQMFNRQNPSAALVAGGAFYVSNPPASIELDLEKAYYRTAFDSIEVKLINGSSYTMIGRYRIYDQKFEIKTEDGIYELRNGLIEQVKLGKDIFTVINTYQGREIIQLHYDTGEYSFASMHGVKLMEPKNKNMFDTSENVRKLKRTKQFLLVYAQGQTVLLKNKRQLMTMLGVYRGSPEMEFIKKGKIDLNKVEGVVNLLEFQALAKRN